MIKSPSDVCLTEPGGCVVILLLLRTLLTAESNFVIFGCRIPTRTRLTRSPWFRGSNCYAVPQDPHCHNLGFRISNFWIAADVPSCMPDSQHGQWIMNQTSIQHQPRLGYIAREQVLKLKGLSNFMVWMGSVGG